MLEHKAKDPNLWSVGQVAMATHLAPPPLPGHLSGKRERLPSYLSLCYLVVFGCVCGAGGTVFLLYTVLWTKWCPPPVHRLKPQPPVLVCPGCYNKISETGWLITTERLFEVQDEGTSMVKWGPFPRLQTSWCVLIWRNGVSWLSGASF